MSLVIGQTLPETGFAMQFPVNGMWPKDFSIDFEKNNFLRSAVVVVNKRISKYSMCLEYSITII